jgi:hypothetical protein
MKDEMDGTLHTHGKNEKYVHNFDRKRGSRFQTNINMVLGDIRDKYVPRIQFVQDRVH